MKSVFLLYLVHSIVITFGSSPTGSFSTVGAEQTYVNQYVTLQKCEEVGKDLVKRQQPIYNEDGKRHYRPADSFQCVPAYSSSDKVPSTTEKDTTLQHPPLILPDEEFWDKQVCSVSFSIFGWGGFVPDEKCMELRKKDREERAAQKETE